MTKGTYAHTASPKVGGISAGNQTYEISGVVLGITFWYIFRSEEVCGAVFFRRKILHKIDEHTVMFVPDYKYYKTQRRPE